MTTSPPAGAADRGAGLPPRESGLTRRRRWLGLLLATVVIPSLTGLLVGVRGDLALGSVLLLYLLVVVVVCLVGGLVAGTAAAALSLAMANFFLTPPYHSLVVESRDSVVALVVFFLVAVSVSALVDVAARRQGAAVRSQAEAAVLGRVAAEPLSAGSAEEVLGEVASTFGLTWVALVERAGGAETVLSHVGRSGSGEPSVSVPVGGDRLLVGEGTALFAEDRRLLSSLAQAASRAVDTHALAQEAARARELAEVDRLRSALLAAVGHDLRTPLAGIKAAATTLRLPDGELSEVDRDQLLATIEDSADRLADLVANLLDLSRLQAGALQLDVRPVPVDEVVGRALIERHLRDVVNDVDDDLPLVLADAALLERVVANLADNAHRHAPHGVPVRIRARATLTSVELVVVDHGPGVDPGDWERMFVPFQRLDDRSSADGSGIGLGLAIARGFTDAMGGTLRPTSTPSGGLTMTVTLPRATTLGDATPGDG